MEEKNSPPGSWKSGAPCLWKQLEEKKLYYYRIWTGQNFKAVLEFLTRIESVCSRFKLNGDSFPEFRVMEGRRVQVIVKLGDFFNSMDVFKIFDVIWPETPAIAAKPSPSSTEACQESSGQEHDNDSGSTGTADSISVSEESSDAEDDNVITTPDPLDDKEEESFVGHDFGVSRESESDAGDDCGATKGLSDVGDDCEVVKEDDSDVDLVVKDGDSIGFKGDDSDDGIGFKEDGSDDGYAAQMKKEGIHDDDRYNPIKECSDGEIDEFMFQNTPWNPIQKRTVSLTDEQIDNCRSDIIAWIANKKPDERGTDKMQLRTQLKEFFVLQTLSTDQRYMEIFKSAEKKLLRESNPSKAKDIKDLVQAYLRRPHASQILSAKAYEWLKHLQMNPPPWFPDQAVELAYGAFRMTGSFEAFVNFLSRPDRRRKLTSIFKDHTSDVIPRPASAPPPPPVPTIISNVSTAESNPKAKRKRKRGAMCEQFLKIKFLQRKQTTAVAYKRIQGGVQPDISLHVTSNFKWSMLSLKLCPYGTPNIQLPFRVEKRYRSKAWSTNCNSCMVESWVHKPYTIMRVQFCKEYIGVRLQFVARVGDLFAATETPIILLKRHAPPPAANTALPSMHSPLSTLTGTTLRSPTSGLQPEKTQLLPRVSPRPRKQLTRLTAPFTQTSHDSHNVYKPPPQEMKQLGQTITLPVTLLKTTPLVTTPATVSSLKAEPLSPQQPHGSSKQITRLTTPFTATSRDSHRVYKARGSKRVGQTTAPPPASAVVAVLTSPMSGQHPEQNQLMTHTSPHKQLGQLAVPYSAKSHDSRGIYKTHDMDRLGPPTSSQAPSSQAVLMTANGGQQQTSLLTIAPPRPLKQMTQLTAPFSPSHDSHHVYKAHDMELLRQISSSSPTRLKAVPSPTSPLSSTQLSSTTVLDPATLESSASSHTSGFCARPNRPPQRHVTGMPSKKRTRAKKGRNMSHRDKL